MRWDRRLVLRNTKFFRNVLAFFNVDEVAPIKLVKRTNDHIVSLFTLSVQITDRIQQPLAEDAAQADCLHAILVWTRQLSLQPHVF